MPEIHRKRVIKTSVYLYPEELELLGSKAAEAGMSKTAYIRRIITYGSAGKSARFTPADCEKICYELNRIGNNINQTAWNSNCRCSVNKDDFDSLIASYKDMVSSLTMFVLSES